MNRFASGSDSQLASDVFLQPCHLLPQRLETAKLKVSVAVEAAD